MIPIILSFNVPNTELVVNVKLKVKVKLPL